MKCSRGRQARDETAAVTAFGHDAARDVANETRSHGRHSNTVLREQDGGRGRHVRHSASRANDVQPVRDQTRVIWGSIARKGGHITFQQVLSRSVQRSSGRPARAARQTMTFHTVV